MKTLTWNIQDMTILVTWDHLWNLTSSGLTKCHLVMTYHYHVHPIIIYSYKWAKNNDIDMKLSGYEHDIWLDWISLYQMRSEDFRYNQIRLDEIRWDKMRSYPIKWVKMRLDEIRCDQMRLDEIRWDQRWSNVIRLDHVFR